MVEFTKFLILGYFKSEFVGLCVNFKTEYWIEKY